MKRLFLIIPLLFVSFCFFFSSKSFAITCGDEGTYLACGAAGGCSVNKQICAPGNAFQGYSCVPATNPDDCKVNCGDAGTDGQCSASGGCGEGYVCTNGSCKSDTTACPTPTIDPMTCIIPGCLKQPCNPGASCMSPLICDTGLLGGTCVESIVPISDVTGGPFCDPKVGESSGINTALGCIKVGSGNDLITSVLRLATGVGGGLALALILYGVFIVTTSAGSPDKLKAGSEIITSAVIGLIFILLSIFLVNLIGINILGIPGLS